MATRMNAATRAAAAALRFGGRVYAAESRRLARVRRDAIRPIVKPSAPPALPAPSAAKPLPSQEIALIAEKPVKPRRVDPTRTIPNSQECGPRFPLLDWLEAVMYGITGGSGTTADGHTLGYGNAYGQWSYKDRVEATKMWQQGKTVAEAVNRFNPHWNTYRD